MKLFHPRLRSAMARQKVSCGDLAAAIGITRVSLVLKIIGLTKWRITEVLDICRFFHVKDAALLFERLDNKS